MILSITTTHTPATDLGYLLQKHPDRVQTFDQHFGKAVVFYPEATAERTTAVLMLDVDPIGLFKNNQKKGSGDFALRHYVNDRPYSANSYLSVAISDVYRSALNGNSKDRPELADTPIPLVAHLPTVPTPHDAGFLRALFEPLGYTVTATAQPLDPNFPEWGMANCLDVTLTGTVRLRELLTHLYVLIPVLDNEKHYWVGDDEVDKLVAKGGEWLPQHPLKEAITRRYLKKQHALMHAALDRLKEAEGEAPTEGDEEESPATAPKARVEEELERKISLHEQRLDKVAEVLQANAVASVLDLGCGEGRLLHKLLTVKQFERIVGMDLSIRGLAITAARLKLDRMPEAQRSRLELLQGSLTYRDDRMCGFDAAAVVEVIEHLNPDRLEAFTLSLFGHARPRIVVVTTPNREYNVMWPSLPAGKMRHPDHRFEWTRAEFRQWAEAASTAHGYTVAYEPVGQEDETVGPPSQMGVFCLISSTPID